MRVSVTDVRTLVLAVPSASNSSRSAATTPSPAGRGRGWLGGPCPLPCPVLLRPQGKARADGGRATLQAVSAHAPPHAGHDGGVCSSPETLPLPPKPRPQCLPPPPCPPRIPSRPSSDCTRRRWEGSTDAGGVKRGRG